MADFNQFELIVNLIVQGIGSWAVLPMKFFSFFGAEEWYLIVFPAVFWCVSPMVGLRLGFILLVSSSSNTFFKLIFHSPRPYWLSLRVQAYVAETSFGLPSGHSQTSAAIWGFLASAMRHRWFTAVCILMIFLIGLSRLFLGVHFLSDVLLGWALGGLTLLLFTRFEPGVTAWVKRSATRQLAWAIAAFSLLLTLLIALPALALQTWPIPAEWSANALAATTAAPIAPFNFDAAFTTGGLSVGLLFGVLWTERQRGGYALGGSFKTKALRYLLGVAVLVVLWYGLGRIFPRTQDLLAYSLRTLRYALLGLWVSAFAPILFKRLHLDL
jgi:membrane-associated phospholipid phosphatase